MKLSPSSGHPYQALAAALVAKIRRGELKTDDRLPPIRVLAKEYEVTVATAQRAVQYLAQCGNVRSVPNVGSFVLPFDESSRVPASLDEVDDRVDQLEASVVELRQTVAGLAERLESVERGARAP